MEFKTYIIAEIGINHNGSLDNALKLIDIAASAGCDAVKFQKRSPEDCVPHSQKYVPKNTPWGKMTYINYKHRMEFSEDEYNTIDDHCKDRKIEWSASAWDLSSLHFLSKYNLPFIKIPSAKLTDTSLLAGAVQSFEKVMISTGMSTIKEVKDAVKFIEEEQNRRNKSIELEILHCNSAYPSPIDQLNLKAIQTLKDFFPKYKIGYSGHELTLGTSVAAVYLGAEILERHVTLDRNMWGSDHSCSVTPWGLFKLVNGVRELEQAYGDGVIKVEESEIGAKKKLRG